MAIGAVLHFCHGIDGSSLMVPPRGRSVVLATLPFGSWLWLFGLGYLPGQDFLTPAFKHFGRKSMMYDVSYQRQRKDKGAQLRGRASALYRKLLPECEYIVVYLYGIT